MICLHDRVSQWTGSREGSTEIQDTEKRRLLEEDWEVFMRPLSLGVWYKEKPATCPGSRPGVRKSWECARTHVVLLGEHETLTQLFGTAKGAHRWTFYAFLVQGGDDKCSLSARADETAVSRHYEPLSHAPESASVPHSISCLQSAGYAVLLVSRHSPWPRRSFHGCAPQKHESISSALTSGDRSRTGGSLWPLWPTCRRMRTLYRAQ